MRRRYLAKRKEQDPDTEGAVRGRLANVTEHDKANPKVLPALVLKDLAAIGIEMDEHFNLNTARNTEINIRQDPAEDTTRKLTLMCQQYALKGNAETKDILRRIAEIKACREHKHYAGLEDKDRKLLRLIAAGGLWTRKRPKRRIRATTRLQTMRTKQPDHDSGVQIHLLEVRQNGGV